jgi:histidine triad (HIT) family protein
MPYDTSNIFARILRGEIPCKAIHEDAFCLAFHDIAPAAPVHVLVIPKGEFTSFDDFTANASPDMLSGFFRSLRTVAAKLGVHESGYRLVANHGADAAQSVAHFHVHILAGRPLGALLPTD